MTRKPYRWNCDECGQTGIVYRSKPILCPFCKKKTVHPFVIKGGKSGG